MKWIVRLLAPAGLALALGSAPGPTLAAEPHWEGALAGRLRQIKETSVVRLGYRESAIPFSYVAGGFTVTCAVAGATATGTSIVSGEHR